VEIWGFLSELGGWGVNANSVGMVGNGMLWGRTWWGYGGCIGGGVGEGETLGEGGCLGIMWRITGTKYLFGAGGLWRSK
jgi:hypothetical protein